SMAEKKATATWELAPAPDTEPEQLWWEQPLQIAPEMTIWVAAPKATWEHTGTITLKAAGLDTVELGEARNTYLEILGQSLGALARALGAMLGREVACAPGEERAPQPVPETGASITLNLGESETCSLWIGFSSKLVAIVNLPPEGRKSEE